MKTYDELKEELQEVFDNLATYERVEIYNEFCDSVNYFDDRIEEMPFLDDVLCSKTATEVIERIDTNNFSTCDDYFYCDGYGYFCSTSDPDDKINDYVDDILDTILSDDNDFCNSDIRDFLDENSDGIETALKDN